jgi:hypothetical protein
MLAYIFLIIVAYFAYRLLVGLVLPLLRAGRLVRQEFAKQHSEQAPGTPPEGHFGSPGGHFGSARTKPDWDKMGDYIDFEEVK